MTGAARQLLWAARDQELPDEISLDTIGAYDKALEAPGVRASSRHILFASLRTLAIRYYKAVQAELAKRGKPKLKATRSQHGIRKGVAELMAESGGSEFEIMSQFGWTEAKTAGIYTKKFKRRGGAVSASQRMAEAAKKATSGPRP